MVNTSHGAQGAEAIAVADTGESLKPSPQSGKKPTSATGRGVKGSRHDASIGKQEALEILYSAVSYCQRAGLSVQAGNFEGRLALVITGASLEQKGESVRFALCTDNPATVTDKQADSVTDKAEASA